MFVLILAKARKASQSSLLVMSSCFRGHVTQYFVTPPTLPCVIPRSAQHFDNYAVYPSWYVVEILPKEPMKTCLEPFLIK